MINFFAWMTAAALLAGDPDLRDINVATLHENYANLHQPLTVLSMRLELLDQRETRFVFTKREELAEDLKMLRKRNLELHGAPQLRDASRFPSLSEVNPLLVRNREVRMSLIMEWAMEGADSVALQRQITEIDRRYQIWNIVRDAKCEYYYVTVRRQALKRLKDMIGETAFAAANLPPAVPEQ